MKPPPPTLQRLVDIARRLKLDRSTGLLVVALLAGLMAALAARQYLSGRVAALEAKGRGEQVRLVVAKTDLAAGAVLSPEVLAIREVPATWAQSSAIRPDEFDRVQGQRLVQPLRSGEMLMWSQLESRRAPTFSARVANGRRAVTVPVDEISSISGLLEPGDRIDVYATVDRAGQRQTVAVLSHVRVLATGQRVSDELGKGDRRLYTTATLDLDPQQARNLLLAREAGRITALLRNPGDATLLADVPADFALWLRPVAPPSPVAMALPGIPVLYGGRNPSPDPQALALLARSLPVVQGAAGDASQPSTPRSSVEAQTASAARTVDSPLR